MAEKFEFDGICDFSGLEDISGTKVKLATEKILKDKAKLSKRYLEFIDRNKDKVFTAKLDIKWDKNNYYYVLEEDETVPKWLFAVDNLIIVDGE